VKFGSFCNWNDLGHVSWCLFSQNMYTFPSLHKKVDSFCLSIASFVYNKYASFRSSNGVQKHWLFIVSMSNCDYVVVWN